MYERKTDELAFLSSLKTLAGLSFVPFSFLIGLDELIFSIEVYLRTKRFDVLTYQELRTCLLT